MSTKTQEKPAASGPAPKQITVGEMAWMAGVIEMRGRQRRATSITRKTPLCILMVETRFLDVLRELSQLTGTRIEVTKSKELPESFRRGCVQHCPEAHQHANPVLPEIGRWHITGVGAAIVLTDLMPYFRTDNAARVSFVSQVINQIPTKGRGRHAINQTIARLRKLGWDVPPYLSTE